MIKNNDTSIKLFNLHIFSKSKSHLLTQIETTLTNSSKISYIFTPNPEQIVQSRVKSKESQQFFTDLQQADWLIPDGVGLVIASRFLSKTKNGTISNSIQERIAGVDLVVELCKLLSQTKIQSTRKVQIIGGNGYTPQDIKKFVYAILASSHSASSHSASSHSEAPNLEIQWTPGFADAKNPTNQEARALEEQIKNFQPTIVFVTLGAPTQERWLIQNRVVLEKNGVRIGMAVGGSFDYLFGKVPRAPQWVRSLGGEWLFRLFVQPWRLKRQLKLVTFIWIALQEKFKKTEA